MPAISAHRKAISAHPLGIAPLRPASSTYERAARLITGDTHLPGFRQASQVSGNNRRAA